MSTKQKSKEKSSPMFTFGMSKKNYILLGIGLFFIVLGFILMSGGGSKDPNVFSEDLFNFRRLTLAPIIIIIGFAIEFFAIMLKFDDEQTQ